MSATRIIPPAAAATTTKDAEGVAAAAAVALAFVTMRNSGHRIYHVSANEWSR